MEKSGMLAKVEGYFKETGAETMVIRGVEPDPSLKLYSEEEMKCWNLNQI